MITGDGHLSRVGIEHNIYVLFCLNATIIRQKNFKKGFQKHNFLNP